MKYVIDITTLLITCISNSGGTSGSSSSHSSSSSDRDLDRDRDLFVVNRLFPLPIRPIIPLLFVFSL